MARIARWARRRVRGAEHFEPASCAPEVGIRESCRIICDKTVAVSDYVGAVSYDNAVCYAYYPVDLHALGNKLLHNQFLGEGRVPQIPLGAMTVAVFDNLLAAGRCAGSDRLANSAIRVKFPAWRWGRPPEWPPP